MKHTKGEWMPKEGQIYPVETGKTLALIPYFDEDNKEQEANAKLIAAAPDLLEACDMVLTAWHSKLSNFNKKEPAYLEIIRSAIRKATE